MWKGKIIEGVRDMKYLGYVIKQNGRQNGQIKDSEKRSGNTGTGVGDVKTNMEGGLGKEIIAL